VPLGNKKNFKNSPNHRLKLTTDISVARRKNFNTNHMTCITYKHREAIISATGMS